MALPEATLTITDGALGIVSTDGTNTPALIGACSSGTAGVAATYSDIKTMKDALGTGPLVEAAAHVLQVAGGSVIVIKPASQVAGSAGSVTATQTGTCTLAVTGAPNDAYQVKVLFIQGAATLAAAAATFKYSLDNGATYSAEIALPASGVYSPAGTGLTLTWTYSSGVAFVAGDYFVFTCTAPSHALADVQTAMDTLIQDNTLSFFGILIVGETASIAAGATMFSAIDTKMAAAASTYYRYAFCMMCLPSDTDANTKSPFVALVSTRVSVAAGFCRLTSGINGASYLRNAGWVAMARAAAVPPGEDLARVRSGAAVGIASLARDEFKTQALDAARFTTLRTFVGLSGFYITNGRIKSDPTSDFEFIQHRRVMDIASSTVRTAQVLYLSESIRVDSVTGRILEADAKAIETMIGGKLRAATVGMVSDSQVTVDRTVNILSTKQLKLTYRIVPFGYPKSVSGEIGFHNPALVPV